MRELYENGFEDRRDEGAFIHESSYVDAPCQIGAKTSIMHFTHIMPFTIIGNHCVIGHNVTIASGVMIGDNVRVLNNALLNSGVILENNVYCGPNTVFSPLKTMRAQTNAVSRVSPTLVRQGANIGPNTTIAAGFTIGQHTFVDAGTVVDRNIPDFALVYGNPLKFGGWRCECGERLKFSDETIACKGCGKTYVQKSERKIIQLKEGQPDLDSNSQSHPPVQSFKRQD